jgi:hypothetical protein
LSEKEEEKEKEKEENFTTDLVSVDATRRGHRAIAQLRRGRKNHMLAGLFFCVGGVRVLYILKYFIVEFLINCYNRVDDQNPSHVVTMILALAAKDMT